MLKIGGRVYKEDRTYICGILNVTPDSFSDGGRFMKMDAILSHAEEMVDDGCDLIDIGAESTRPGFTRVPADEEIGRLLPVIEALKVRFDVPISVDTYKWETAQASLGAGADLINDIRGLHPDPQMLKVIAAHDVPCILMHDGPAPSAEATTEELCAAAELARNAGTAKEKIILDPGIGFGKTQEQNLNLLHHLDVMTAAGYPVLLGASRKSVIGYALDLPVEEREEATMVTSVFAAIAGCRFVRVHDVRKNRRAVDMTAAILSR